jgi:hypothetical protein
VVLQDAYHALLDWIAVGIKRPVVVVEFDRPASWVCCAVRLACREIADILNDRELATVRLVSLVKFAPNAKQRPAQR